MQKVEPKFKLGDVVFMASYERHETSIVCPDCLGSAKVRVILGDGTELKIECGGCDPGGYQPSTGRIRQYDYATKITKRVITGINLTDKDVEYRLDGEAGHCYIGYQNSDYRVFATEEDAKKEGEALRVKHESEENKTLLAKTKNHRTWSWNMHYHRQQITRLEREIEFHREKVEICKSHGKED